MYPHVSILYRYFVDNFTVYLLLTVSAVLNPKFAFYNKFTVSLTYANKYLTVNVLFVTKLFLTIRVSRSIRKQSVGSHSSNDKVGVIHHGLDQAS